MKLFSSKYLQTPLTLLLRERSSEEVTANAAAPASGEGGWEAGEQLLFSSF